MYKFGYVAILGRPNAGKSTLINKLVGEKVAIVSSKPQTTRNNIIGVLTSKNYQLAFLDTPGIHKSASFLDKYMMKNVRTAKAGADVILYLLDSSKTSDEQEVENIDKMKNDGVNLIVAKSKSDMTCKNNFKADLCFSAVTGENIQELIDLILSKLPSSKTKNFLFSDDEFTDKSLKFYASEFIREATLTILDKEIPHGLAVVVTDYKEKTNLVKIDAEIVCSRENHKGIIIGKAGKTLKKIGTKARISLEEFLEKKVMLNLFVKVEKDWQNNPNKLTILGYN